MASNSPSSIITYKQCPRLYYYRFLQRRESFPHIDLIKGNLVHSTLQGFFSEKPPIAERNYEYWAHETLRKIFIERLSKKRKEIQSLKLSDSEIENHYLDCWEMLNHWLEDFFIRIDKTGKKFKEAFEQLKPLTETEVYVKEYDIKGYIEVIDKSDGDVKIIDYKTSSAFDISKEHKLQIAIYAYLYYKKYGIMPDKVGIHFLREKLHLISVDKSMIDFAERECKEIHEKTKSRDIKDYPQNEGYLCKALGRKCPCHKYEED